MRLPCTGWIWLQELPIKSVGNFEMMQMKHTLTPRKTPRKTNKFLLNINGFSRCIYYWKTKTLFRVDMSVFLGVYMPWKAHLEGVYNNPRSLGDLIISHGYKSPRTSKSWGPILEVDSSVEFLGPQKIKNERKLFFSGDTSKHNINWRVSSHKKWFTGKMGVFFCEDSSEPWIVGVGGRSTTFQGKAESKAS